MKFLYPDVWGIKHALRGMRNPMNSWDKHDSGYLKHCIYKDEDKWCRYDHTDTKCQECETAYIYDIEESTYVIGKNDLQLAQKLIKGGPEHRKFLRQIMVSVDITAPLYWWKEFDTYKVGTTANSTSTMHKLASQPITLDCFEIKDYDETIISDVWLEDEDGYFGFSIEDNLIPFLEGLRQKYLETKDKRYWKELVRWLPESWLQTRTVTMNYENLRNMYFQRRNHKLTEWSVDFVKFLTRLPYAEELIFYTGEEIA